MQSPNPESNRSKKKAEHAAILAARIPTRSAGKTDGFGVFHHPRLAVCCECGEEKIVWNDEGSGFDKGILYSIRPKCEECSK